LADIRVQVHAEFQRRVELEREHRQKEITTAAARKWNYAVEGRAREDHCPFVARGSSSNTLKQCSRVHTSVSLSNMFIVARVVV
jgi:hypothetical protein